MNNLRPWSYSRYNAFKTCLYRGCLKYIKKVKSIPSEAMQEGLDTHKYFEAYFYNNIENILEYETAERLRAIKKVEHLCKGDFNFETFLSIDENGNTCEDKKNIFMLGRIDAHNGRTVIIDWKMGQMFNYDVLQMDWYYVLIAAWYKITNIMTGTFVFPMIDTTKENIFSKTISYYPENCANIFNNIKEKIIKIEQKINKLNPENPQEWEYNCSECKNCTVWQECCFYNKPIEIDGLTLKHPAQLTTKTFPDAVLFVKQVKDLITKSEKTLRDFVKKHGNQIINNEEYGFHVGTNRKGVNIEKLFNLTSGNFDKFTISPTNIEKICNEIGINSIDFIEFKEKKYFGFKKNE